MPSSRQAIVRSYSPRATGALRAGICWWRRIVNTAAICSRLGAPPPGAASARASDGPNNVVVEEHAGALRRVPETEGSHDAKTARTPCGGGITAGAPRVATETEWLHSVSENRIHLREVRNRAGWTSIDAARAGGNGMTGTRRLAQAAMTAGAYVVLNKEPNSS